MVEVLSTGAKDRVPTPEPNLMTLFGKIGRRGVGAVTSPPGLQCA